MDDKYANNKFAKSIEEINNICGYKKDQKHVLIFKDPNKWIESIQRWEDYTF